MSEQDYRPQPKTLQKVVNYLESIGLNVYGQSCNLDTGQEFNSLSDFDADDVVKYRKLYEQDAFWRIDEDM